MATLRVIVIEDRAADAELMLGELRRVGFDIESRLVQSDPEFAQALEAGADVILAGYSLPGFGAIPALRRMKGRNFDIPMIVVTGAVGDEAAAECIKLGAIDYVLKTRLNHLGRSVTRALEARGLREDRRRAEHELIESEDRFQTLLNALLDAALIVDEHGIILAVNNTALKLLHVPSIGEMIGRSFNEFADASEQNASILEHASRVQKDRGGFLGEHTLKTTQNEQKRIDVICTQVRFLGEPASLLILKDITERRRMEDVLWESQERYRTLFTQMHNGMALHEIVCDDAGQPVDYVFLAVNPSFERLTGLRSDQVLGRSARQVIPNLEPFWIETYGRVALTGEPTHFTSHSDAFNKFFHVTAFCPKKGQFAAIFSDITESKRMEEELRLSEEKYRTVADFTHDWEYWLSPDGEFQYVSPSCKDITGYSADEFKKDPGLMASLVHPEDQPAFRHHHGIALQGPAEVCSMDFRIVTEDGHARWINHCCRSVFDSDGVWVGRRGSNRDITERKQSEDALRHSEAMLQSILRAAPIGIGLVSPDRVFRWVNDVVCTMTGYRREELVGQSERILYEDNAAFQRVGDIQYGEIRRTGNGTIETQWKRNDGAIIDILLSSASINPSDPADGVTFTALDITERKHMEINLRQTNQTLAAVFQAAPLAVIALDPAGNIKVWNQGAVRMFGWAEEEVLNRPVPTTPPDRQEEVRTLTESILRGESVSGMETKRLKKDGSLIEVRISAAPLRNASGEISGMMAALEDIHEKKSLEAQLFQAQKLESVGRLAGGVAHDFNNLLTVINGNTELAIDTLDERDPIRKDLEEVLKAGDRASALTRQLLAFSRKQILQPEVLSLNAVVEDMEKMLHRLIGEHIELETFLDPQIGRVKADFSQMGQVLMNLIVNARDAMPQGGHLLIETSSAVLDQRTAADIPDARPGTYATLSISDTGTGMDTSTLSHLFEPFFTTKDKGRGTGLGLSTVYGIAKQSGGFISVQSEPSHGSTFQLFLPCVDEPLAAETEHVTPQSVRGNETILVAEDEDGVRSLICRTLRNNGYAIFEARTGEEALGICGNTTRAIHMAVCDMVMPMLGGRQLGDLLAATRPGIRVLFISGYSDDTGSEQNFIAPDQPFLQKPFTTTALLQKVREVLDKAPSPEKPS